MKTKTIIGQAGTAPLRQSRCIYTVSVHLTDHLDRELAEGHKWAIKKFGSVLCVIGDGPLLERTASIVGARTGLLRQRRKALMEMFPDALLMSQLEEEDDFAAALEDVDRAVRRDKKLRLSIERDAHTYVRRVAVRGDLVIPQAEADRVSREYIALEVAMYLTLVRRGYLVDVYLGQELSTLKAFMRGEFQPALPELAARSFVGLIPELAT